MNSQIQSRLLYDDCNFNKTIEESTGPYNYIFNTMNENEYSNCNHAQSPFQKTNNKFYKGDFVDIDTELRGTNFINSRCPENKFPYQSEYYDYPIPLQNCNFQELGPEYTKNKKSMNINNYINKDALIYTPLIPDVYDDIKYKQFTNNSTARIGTSSRLLIKDLYNEYNNEFEDEYNDEFYF